MNRRSPLAVIAVLVLAVPALAQKEFGFDNRKPSGQPYLAPEETVKRMKVAPEFEVKLFAGEPQVANPIAFTLDEKGRVWVVECFEYPSRTPKGKAPRDRIVILEDTDGDGACDKRTVFAEGKDFPIPEERRKAGLGAFDLASGIEVGNGGVYVGVPPYLWFIENKNDKPGKFETLLSGFGSQDTHETLNTFQWGPDGWLYGLHGVFTQSTVKPLDGPETRMNAAVWRFHPKAKKFEIFAEGTSNPWGLDWRNTDGQFILCCCVIPHLYHIVPGGIYKRQAGTSYNPYAYGYINEICDHTFHRESGWAHAGLIALDVPHFPEKYRNSVIFGSIHGCSVKQNVLKPNGSSFTATRGDDFLVSGDKNFRPINMKWGPLGDIYLIDWHDQNPCHQAKAEDWDYERGRVYRIQLKGTQPKKAEDLSALGDDALVGKLGDANPFVSRQALRLTYERFAGKPRPAVNAPKVRKWEDLRTLHATGAELKFDPAVVEADAPLAAAWLARFAADRGQLTDRELVWMAEAAWHGPEVSIRTDPVIRREIASTCVRLAGTRDVTAILHLLMWMPNDGGDPLLPHLIWLAYEKALAGANNAVLDAEFAWFVEECQPKPLKADRIVVPSVTITDHILPKLMRRMVATGKPEHLARCIAFLGKVSDNYVPVRSKALEGLVAALQGQMVDAPAGWAELQTKLLADPKSAPLAEKLAVSFRDPAAYERAMKVLLDHGKPDVDRAEAVRQLAAYRRDGTHRLLVSLVRRSEPLPVRVEAARGLVGYDNLQAGRDLLGGWKDYPPALRNEVVNTLSGRKEWARLLLGALDSKAVDRREVTDNTIIRIQAFNDKEMNALIEKTWGRTRPTPKELDSLIAKMRGELKTPGSFARGKLVFEAQCAKCHKFDGKGSDVGPPLDGAARDIDYILANVIDPNRVIGAPYFQRIAKTLDGVVEQGLLAEEDDRIITLKVENGVLKKLKKADLEGPVQVIEKSMMPEGLTAGMSMQDFRDLVRYLMANPFLTEVTVNGQPAAAGVNGYIQLPDFREEGTATVEATVTAAGDVKTELLVGARDAFEVLIDGKLAGRGGGAGDRPAPDARAVPMTLPAGTHTVTIRTKYAGGGRGVYARYHDPDRKLSYSDPGAKK